MKKVFLLAVITFLVVTTPFTARALRKSVPSPDVLLGSSANAAQSVDDTFQQLWDQLIFNSGDELYHSPTLEQDQVMASNPELEQARAAAMDYIKGCRSETKGITEISVFESYALATWVCSEGGGNVALIKKGGSWNIVAGGGGAMDPKNLEESGIPIEAARKLLDRLHPDWREYTPKERQ